MTVRRGWKARENVVDPASITSRSYRTLRLVGGSWAELRRPTTVCNDSHRQRFLDRPRVAASGGSRRAAGGGASSRRSVARRPSVERSASLAQSAERFHGKEKVVGSIPTGGSPADSLRIAAA